MTEVKEGASRRAQPPALAPNKRRTPSSRHADAASADAASPSISAFADAALLRPGEIERP